MPARDQDAAVGASKIRSLGEEEDEGLEHLRDGVGAGLAPRGAGPIAVNLLDERIDDRDEQGALSPTAMTAAELTPASAAMPRTVAVAKPLSQNARRALSRMRARVSSPMAGRGYVMVVPSLVNMFTKRVHHTCSGPLS